LIEYASLCLCVDVMLIYVAQHHVYRCDSCLTVIVNVCVAFVRELVWTGMVRLIVSSVVITSILSMTRYFWRWGITL